MAGDGQHRLAVALGVVEAVEQMYSAGPRSGHADAEPVGEFGITAGRKGGRLLVADLNKPQLVLIVAEGFKDSVNAISRGSRKWCPHPNRLAFRLASRPRFLP